MENEAGSEGSDIYVQDALPPLIVENSQFRVKNQAALIVNRRSSFQISNSSFTGEAGLVRREPVLRCTDCRDNRLSFNTFQSLSVSSTVEAVFDGTWLGEMPSFTIEGNSFKDIEASNSGGALFVKWPGRLTVKRNTFQNIRAERAGSQGGAIYCSVVTPEAKIKIQDNLFRACQAEKGGAILWDHYEPLLLNNEFA